MPPQPLLLSPATPSSLISHILSHQKYPTTLIIGCAKEDFLDVLINDVHTQPTPNATHPLLKASLYQIAISRHIRIIFTPTVTHLRAALSVFSPQDPKVAPPPNHVPGAQQPLLLIYGLLELHRGASEWSAQGIGVSTSLLVEGAVRNGFRPVMVEPRGAGGHETLEQVLGQMIPLLNGSTMKEDGSWNGRIVSMKRVLGRWFTFETREWDPEECAAKTS
jgi:hypothetical protein